MIVENNSLFFYTYKGRVETDNSTAMIIDIGENASNFDYETLRSIVISLKHSGSFAEPDAIEELLGGLDKIKEKLELDLVLIDYCHTLFERLQPYAKKYHIKLLHDLPTAKIFIEPDDGQEKSAFLIFETDKKRSQEIQEYLEKRGCKTVIASDTPSYQKLCKSKKFDAVITDTALNLAPTSTRKHLSKELILNLPLFIDNVAQTLSSVTDLEAKKLSHGIQKMPEDCDSDALSAMMRFKGDVEGSYLLIFPKSLAFKAMAAFTGESIDKEDLKGLKDSVGEFCNIITGNIKTALQNNKTQITFELPKTFEKIQEVSKDIAHKEGVWINMLLDQDPFYIFITN